MKLAWQQIPSTVVSELLCNVGLDGVVLDTEHGFFNNETLYNCIQLITSIGKICFVRLTEPSKTMTRACLDAGANGIIFSTTETEEQCEVIHEICKFPSQGGRRGLGLVRQNKWGIENITTDKPIIIAQIETIRGIENLKEISSYGFDYYMIGPYDLSASLGDAANFESQDYLSAIEKVKSLIPNNKMAVHIPKDVKNQLQKYQDYGIIAVGMDTTGLLEFYKEMA
jgi:2-dehydro-3-deoxyglucarate aldolase